MNTVHIKTSQLTANTGQIAGVPSNPRQWTKEDIDKTAKSITEDADFLEDRPVLVIPRGDQYVAFAGNLRLTAAKHVKLTEVTCVVYEPESDEDWETIKRRAMKDNGAFGAWDFDALANEWDDLPLVEWGVPAWEFREKDARPDFSKGLSTEGREGGEGYDDFMDKFKPKLTTDDCYTPVPVYEAIKGFVSDFIKPLDGVQVVRPFYPGGDYKREDYPEGCVVIDNPPFSIVTEIVRYYVERGIPFFLFAPSLTGWVAKDTPGLTYIVSNSEIEYENGAQVRTSFVTNMMPGVRVWLCGELNKRISDAQESEGSNQPVYVMPANIVTAARLQKLVGFECDLKIGEDEITDTVRKLYDKATGQKKDVYGGGYEVTDAVVQRLRELERRREEERRRELERGK